MTEQQRKRLQMLMADICEAMLDDAGEGRSHEAASRMLATYPEECQTYASQAMMQFLVAMARRFFKQTTKQHREQDQLLLPGFPRDTFEALPRTVAVPQQGSDDCIYRPLFGPHAVKQEELLEAINYLSGQIIADTKRRDALIDLYKYRQYQQVA